MAIRLGKYQLRRPLGAGAMGEVWEAVDTVLDRPVAVKLLTGDGDDPRDCVREAAAAARVTHPNAVAVYDAAEIDGRWVIVMELVNGPNAARVVADRGRLPWAEATGIARDAANGLSAVHAAGFVHRDVKPGNILIAPNGTAKVADFGLAKRTTRSGLTTVTGVAGTPHYMSPEQCWNELADARADVYSLGATYYTLLTGRPPFAGDTPMAVMYAHCHSPVPDPRAVAADVPAGCAAVVRRAMAKPPADRFASADELRAALDDLLAGADAPAEVETAKSIRLPPATVVVPPVRKPFPTRRVALTAGVGALAAAGLTGFACWPRSGITSPPTGPASPPTPPSPPADEPDWATLPPFKGAVQQIAITQDGRTVAVTVDRTDGKGDIHLFSRDGTPRPGWPLPAGAAEGVAFTPDGKAVAAAFRFDGVVRVYTVADGRPVSVAEPELRAVSVVQFSSDGEWMAAGGFTDQGVVVRFWKRDADRGWVAGHPCSAAEYSIWGFRFVPGRSVVALAAGVGPVDETQATLRLFDAPTGRQVKELPLDRRGVGPTVAFAADAPLAAVSSFGRVHLFRLPDWEAIDRRLDVRAGAQGSEVRALAVSPDGAWVAGGRDVDVHLWRAEDGVGVCHRGDLPVDQSDRHRGTVNTLAFTPDGKRLLSGGEDGKVIAHDHADLYRKLKEGRRD